MIFAILICLFVISCTSSEEQNTEIKVGSKKFTESVILGEIITQLAESKGAQVNYRKELGGTRVLWNALRTGDIDIYPEYTGTITQEIHSSQDISSQAQLREQLSKQSIEMSDPLGFNNTYALGMKKERASELGIETISDLRNHPDLKFGFTSEFLNRGDGWPSIKKAYDLPQQNVTGLDHDLAYRGLESGHIDVVDLYSTDAEISYYNIKVLKDNEEHFKDYFAVLLYRSDLVSKNPDALSAILNLQGNISEQQMVDMNAQSKLQGVTDSVIASNYLRDENLADTTPVSETFLSRLYRNTLQHLFLVVISLSAAIIVSIPLGIFAYKNQKVGQLVLGIVGVIQTLPSLALLVFMIPFFGIGAVPAIVALFLYSLLPIVRNTYSGLKDIPTDIKESAEALGLSDFARLRLIEIPLASRSILSGIKTSAVINVGTATLGALIGAGGYGQPILTGIRLDNIGLILEGAVPAAVLALLVQGLFDLSERVLVPKGLRLSADNR
ncbi:MAG: glycine betaine ABC transporter substrate-binding protein [Thermodesulfobacteriota bacterium]